MNPLKQVDPIELTRQNTATPVWKNKKVLYALGVLLAVIILAALLATVLSHAPKDTTSPRATAIDKQEPENQPSNRIKNVGFNLDYYDPATKKAGDLAFVTIPALNDPAFASRLWMDYGALDKREGHDAKRNPQPAFILPAGTKITAMVDGEVVSVTPLYSKDYSVMIASSQQSTWRFEHEHVVHPTVKVGDRVKAGDVIAEVGAHENWEYGGNGIFEIGILRPGPNGKGGGAECPFNYLDTSVKNDIQAKISAFYTAWEQFRGDPTIYDQEHFAQPGCEIADPIKW